MKKIFFTFFLSICFSWTAYNQIKIGDNPQSIDASSVLELESTSHVLVITRVTTLEMDAIIPKPGGMVYNTDTECVHYYNGLTWINMCNTGGLTNVTTEPLINNFKTIVITPNAGLNHIEVGIINGNQIQENSLNGGAIIENSITDEELAQNSVTSFQVDNRSLQAEDFADNTPNQILGTDANGIVNWLDVALLSGAYSDQESITGAGTTTDPFKIAASIARDIDSNTAAIASDGDTSATNELQDLNFNANILTLTNPNLMILL